MNSFIIFTYVKNVNTIQNVLGFHVLFYEKERMVVVDSELDKKIGLTTSLCKMFNIKSLVNIDPIKYDYIKHTKIIVV